MYEFLSGATAMACLVVCLFFVRFWRETHDRLFFWFSVAFGVFSVNRVAIALARPSAESTPYFFILRLVAFLLIAFAIIDKNRQR